VPLSEEDIREILRLIDESDVEELRIETEELSLHVVRGGTPVSERAAEAGMRAGAVESGAVEAPAGGAAVPADDLHMISAPMLGTFYRAEAPGAPPFVEVGTRVEPDTVVCLIEVMKMMNSIPAGVVGTIVDVCADNAQLVEYGAALFLVQPDR
jgi:acetyl-CoA carboxylase biotin carboxyl carrier protein